jgi:hypothetical protein
MKNVKHLVTLFLVVQAVFMLLLTWSINGDVLTSETLTLTTDNNENIRGDKLISSLREKLLISNNDRHESQLSNNAASTSTISTDESSRTGTTGTTRFTAVGFWKYFEEGRGSYHNFMDVSWIIVTRNPTCHVVVEFIYIHIEQDFDNIFIYPLGKDVDPNTKRDDTRAGPWYASINNKLTVQFVTDFSVTYDGFRARYMQNCAENIDSRNWQMFTATNSWKTLDYRAQKAQYDLRQERHYLIKPSDSSCRVIIEFTQVDLDNPTVSGSKEGDYVKILEDGRAYEGYTCVEDDEGLNCYDHAVYPLVGERQQSWNFPRSELGIEFVTDSRNSAKGFTCKYKQDCTTSNDHTYTQVLYATSEWKFVKNPYPVGVPHAYGMYVSYDLRPTHAGCKVMMIFNSIRDLTSYYLLDYMFGISTGGFTVDTPVSGHTYIGDGIFVFWSIMNYIPYVKMFDAQYIESC